LAASEATALAASEAAAAVAVEDVEAVVVEDVEAVAVEDVEAVAVEAAAAVIEIKPSDFFVRPDEIAGRPPGYPGATQRWRADICAKGWHTFQ
jgi:hypothetical protein